ncbi:MAG: RNA polymerase sigma factor [Verrucomicrobia bacterium]|nr:RNA polymerase sigma factor [Verrucomicrobiota bacterium]
MQTTPSELAALLQQARNGNEPAQEGLVRLYQGRVAGFVYSFLGRADLVEDLCQEIFVRMLLGLPRMKKPAQFEAWLFRIARNRCLDELRRQRWRRIFVPWQPEHDELPPPASPPDPTAVESLAHAMQTLPSAQRELLSLIQDGDWSYEQLAEMTGSTVSSVKSRLFRAREQLKARFSHEC